ncbi:MAG TPA: hypothetical protein VMV22_08845 [Acidimicrobiales bacterium]|nr:hypothetical protein [Acidimicrobiales bacterium]
MPALEAFLRRLRFPGVPGAPGAAGVPVDRAVEVASELAPVFALLAEAERRAADLVRGAEQHAARRRADADEEAERLVAEARAGAGAELARTARADLDRSADECRAQLAVARAEVERVERVSRERMPAVVDSVVRAVTAAGRPVA